MNIKYKRPKLYDKQAAFIDDEARFTFVEAGTKAGKTTGMIIWIHEEIISDSGSGHAYWWVAPVYSQAEMAFNRLWKFIPDAIKGLFKKNESDLTIMYPNGNKAFFKSGEKPDNLYGDDVYGVVIDEASRLRVEAWYAINSTLTYTKGKAKVIGNVKGRKNWFFTESTKARSGHVGYSYHKLTSLDNPYNDSDVIEEAKRNLPPNVFEELYLAVPSDDVGNPFGFQYIKSCVKDLSKNEPIVFGIDLAKSIDWTVITGMDANNTVCYFDRFQMPWENTINKILSLPRGAKMAIDSTGVGDPIVEKIQRSRGGVEGYKFDQQSKQRLMDGLSLAIQTGKIGFPQGIITDELESFEYEYTRTGVRYSAPQGMHDDCVCSLALANYKSQKPMSANFGSGDDE